MAIVTEISWDDMFDGKPVPDNAARTAWRDAVAEIADKAHEKLPECNGRIDKAVALILAGDVELQADGTARVASQSNGTTQYVVCNGHCTCKDYQKAPHNFCKHRLSAAIVRRARELAKQKLTQLDGASTGQAIPASQPTAPPAATAGSTEVLHLDLDPAVCAELATQGLPEAPASVNCHITLAGRQVQVTLRDTDETRLLARLESLLQRFPVAAEPAAEQAPPAGWCGKHGVQMTLHHGKDGSTWYSHKTADGWCKGK